MEILAVMIILVGGLFAGILNAVVGGGSLISVPVLMISGLPTQIAIGTNRFAMIFNSGVAALDYYKVVKYEIKMILIPSFVTSLGSIIGASTVLQIDEILLKYVIAFLMLVMGGVLFYKKELGLDKTANPFPQKNYIIITLLSFVLGFYGGFYGAGVSTMFSFFFVSYIGITFIKSAGITRFVVTGLSVIAALIFFLNSKIDFLYGGLLTIGFILGAKIGVKVAIKVGNLWIKRLMIFLVIVSSIKLIFF